jgi:hypothetical protein
VVSLWLAAARGEVVTEAVRPALAALQALAGSLDERFTGAGVTGRAGVLDAHRRLAGVLGVLDAERLVSLRAAIAALERELEHAGRVLERLRRVKEAFDGPAGAPARDGG